MSMVLEILSQTEPTLVVFKAWVVPAIAAVAGIASQIIQNRQNKKIADRQNELNTKFQDKQNEYNTPQNQMLRFQDAGLNPNLIYGQGNAGNQSSPQQAEQRQPVDWSKAVQAIPLINQTKMVDSQVQANNAKTLQALAATELNKIQQQVAKRNPLMDDSYLTSLVDSMRSSAQIKASEAAIKAQEARFKLGDGESVEYSNGYHKMELELQMLYKRYDLASQDQAIKAAILKSKEFQNDILEVQKKFMTDAEITPQHILTFIQLLLMKML